MSLTCIIFFPLQREGVSLELDTKTKKDKKVKIKGYMLLTTVRITVIGKCSDKTVHAFDIPLQKISGEQFDQPAFSANSLSGTLAPLPPSPYNFSRKIDAPCRFSIKFKEGGAATFLKFFYYLMDKYRRADIRSREAVLAPQPIHQWISTQAQAFLDPSDPSRLYVAPLPQVQYSADHYHIANAYRYSTPPAGGPGPYNPHAHAHPYPQPHPHPQPHYPPSASHPHQQPYPQPAPGYPPQPYPGQAYPAQAYPPQAQYPPQDYQAAQYAAQQQAAQQQAAQQQYAAAQQQAAAHQYAAQQQAAAQQYAAAQHQAAAQQYAAQQYAAAQQQAVAAQHYAAQQYAAQQASATAAAVPTHYQYPAAVPDSAYDPVKPPKTT